MLLRLATVLAFFASSVAAVPNLLESRAKCNADNCYRAVVASRAAPRPSSGKADCSSFFLATKTLCPSTVFVTATTTSTGLPITSTVTVPVTTTQFTTDSISVTTTVSTIQDTLIITSTSIVTSLEIDQGTVTAISTIFAKKRDQQASSRPHSNPNAELGQRDEVSSCPSVRTPTAVPTYASACSGTSRYSSACLCNGVLRSTITTQSTTTLTVTATSIVVPTCTVTATSNVVVPVTVVSTNLISTTFETTDATSTIVLTSTTVQTSTSFTTVLVSQTTSCSEFIAQATSGLCSGQYLQYQSGDSPLVFQSSLTAATTFVRLDNGQIALAADQTSIFNTNNGNDEFVFCDSDYVANQVTFLTCTFGSNGATGVTIPGGSALVCQASDGKSKFSTCPSISVDVNLPSDSLVFSNGAILGDDCQFLEFLALPAC